jgi:peptidyl-Lys metalloendopeptidase
MKSVKQLAAGLAISLLAFGVASADPVTVSLSAGAKSDIGTGKLRYSITNPGKVDLLVLAWETPLRGVEDDLFEVRGEQGDVAEYVGRQFKRGLPQPEDYIEIKAGATLSVDVDLSAHYSMRKAGTYAVQFVGHFHDSFAVKPKRGGENLLALSEQDLRSEIVSLWVDGSGAPEMQDKYGVLNMAKAGSVSYVGCSNTQASSVSSGVTAAKSMASSATSYLGNGTVGPRYTTWFGTYSSSNYNTVKSNFTKIADALNNKPLEFYCDCTSTAYAYVYPTQPYKIHLCKAFWNAPTSGTDSKGGTTIHEVSHFDIVANTDDIQYGQTACKRLASQPKKAIKNADSHEYFAENTPSLN